MAIEDALDLCREDADTAAFYHIFLAADNKEVALFVAISQIAGVEPAVAKMISRCSMQLPTVNAIASPLREFKSTLYLRGDLEKK